MVMKRLHLYVSGRVQGVFYRARTCEKAASLGLGGWVRNLPDGRVEALFEGKEKDLRSVLEWCRRGPQRSRPEGVEIHWGEYSGEFSSFEIRY